MRVLLSVSFVCILPVALYMRVLLEVSFVWILPVPLYMWVLPAASFVWNLPVVPGKIKFSAKKIPNFLPGTLAIYRIVNIWNDQQMSLISHFRGFNSSFKKCRLKIANREWKMFHEELSAAVNKYWCVFSGRIIYTEKE